MSYGHHREELLLAVNRATKILELNRDFSKKQNEELLASDIPPELRAIREGYDFDAMHEATMVFVKDIHHIMMAAKSIEELDRALHAEIQSLLPSYCIHTGDPNEMLHLRKFLDALYSEYAHVMEETPRSELSPDDPARAEHVAFEEEQNRISHTLLDAVRFTNAGNIAIDTASKFASALNPLSIPTGQEKPQTFGFIAHKKFQDEHLDMFADVADEEVVDITPELGLEIQNNALAVCYDIVGEFVPENCSPKLGRVEMFYLIGRAVCGAAQQLKGEAYTEADMEEYMQDDQVIDLARQLVEPVFAKYYQTMFKDFDGFAQAAKMTEDRIDKMKEIGYAEIETDPNIIDLDVPVGDDEEDIPYDPDDSELDSVIPKKRILVDAKEYADRRLPLAVNFVIKKMERIYSIRLEQAEVLQQIGSTIENDPHFVHPIEVQIRHENVISALKDLKYGLQHTYTRADQEKQLHAYQDSMIEDVIYDGLPIGSYSDLRLTLDMIQERLTNGLYRSDDHPWIDLFAKLSEKGEICDQVYDDLCNVYHAKQHMNGIPKTLEDGKPNPKWHYTPYNEAMEAFFDGEVPDRQLTIAEREQIDEMTQEMTKDLLAPYSQGLPEDSPEVMFWFVARATEYFANQELPFAQRVKERTPPRITRGDLTVIECLPEEPDPERLTAVEARRKAMHIVTVEDPTLLSEAMVKKSKGKKRKPKEADETSRYNSEEVRAKVDALLNDIFSDPACKDAATNIDHLLAAKTKLEAKLRNTSVSPSGPDNPSIDQGR